jgi:RNA polymerase sigma-70 factor (ECF subfamily)
VALTLKTLCGFSIPEIADAFLTNAETISKRLVRARKELRVSNVAFDVPAGSELEPRLSSVLEIVYLLFNEGYNSTHGNEVIRYDLCEEAIRLARMIEVNETITRKSNVNALLALMLLNASRYKARIVNGSILDLEEQDRTFWNQEMIAQGLRQLELAVVANTVSIYHILATISAHHCTANDYQSTDWTGILELYDNLKELDQSPVVYLNRIVALSMVKGPEIGLQELETLPGKERLRDHLPFYTTKAQLLFEAGKTQSAIGILQGALNREFSEASKELIYNQLNKFQKKVEKKS